MRRPGRGTMDRGPMSPPKPKVCLNCAQLLHGAFCSSCGQKVMPSPVTLRDLAKEVFEETFELDGRVPRTLGPLFFKPGFLTREYNLGRRRAYTSPLRLFLGVGVLWVLVAFSISQWRVFHPRASISEAQIQIDDTDEPGALVDVVGLEGTAVGDVLQARIDKFQALPNAEKGERIRSAASDLPPAVAFALFPVFTAFLTLVLLRSGRTVPEHAVFALHVHAFGLFIMTLVRVVGDDLGIVVGFVVFGLYVLLALRHAYNLSWWGTLWRWTVLAVAFSVITFSVFLIAVLGTAISS